MLGFSQLSKPIKWQDLLEKDKMAAMRFEQVQRFILAKKIFWGYGHFNWVPKTPVWYVGYAILVRPNKAETGQYPWLPLNSVKWLWACVHDVLATPGWCKL